MMELMELDGIEMKVCWWSGWKVVGDWMWKSGRREGGWEWEGGNIWAAGEGC
jgi:hypothetical protein